MTNPLDTQVGGDHYKQMVIQPVEFSEKNKLSFLEGCVVKRVCRHSRGGRGREDICKAIHELELILKLHYEKPLNDGLASQVCMVHNFLQPCPDCAPPL